MITMDVRNRYMRVIEDGETESERKILCDLNGLDYEFMKLYEPILKFEKMVERGDCELRNFQFIYPPSSDLKPSLVLGYCGLKEIFYRALFSWDNDHSKMREDRVEIPCFLVDEYLSETIARIFSNQCVGRMAESSKADSIRKILEDFSNQ